MEIKFTRASRHDSDRLRDEVSCSETETRVDSLHEESSHELHCSTNVVVEDTEMYVKTSIGQLDDGCEE